VLIKDAEENGPVGTELENWLADFDFDHSAFTNICHSKAITEGEKTLSDGSIGYAFAQDCTDTKYIYVSIQGGNGVDWPSMVKEVTTTAQPACTVNSRRHWHRCIYELDPAESHKFAISIGAEAGTLKFITRLKNL
jgi:uncharacterized protein YfiM (DUF2279 family)